ncbi:putative multidrug resistance-associated protein [Trematosphaeria pertusa]|uniref:Putative multidrug resistance-associated protein n=1 Tax=Trematosphaeria pertusa TaxID=390896 RepID=A0A6A6ITH4_9PLEO|nr:putative multidrug resistance-associated protein [Trematosphaeria pertusa]KAF2253629.1 putative multidrug resistance-associated protein [Trematosphaeria pertusa]
MSHCDESIGPRVDPSCRSFDFTLYFQDLFFSTTPNAILLVLLVLPVARLLRAQDIVRRTKSVAVKAALYVVLFTCQTIFLALRCRQPQLHTPASVATDVLAIVATLAAASLSWLQHHRSEQPSAPLAIFFALISLLNVARVRSLWLIPHSTGPAVLQTLVLLQGAGLLLAESLGKKKALRFPEKFHSSGPEPFTGFWNLVGFSWLLGTLRRGYRSILSVDDLPDLDYRLDSEALQEKLARTWSKYDKTQKRSLLMACFRAYATSFLSAIIPRLILSALKFTQPFMITKLIHFVGDKGVPDDFGRGLIGAYALVYLGMAASAALYGYMTFRFLIRLRGGLIALIYQQTVEARAVDLGSINGLTLMGTDVERIVLNFQTIHEVWASLVDIAIAIFLLQRQMFLACLVPGGVTFIFALATFKFSAWAKAAQRVWIENVERRLGVTTVMIGAMRTVKMLGLSGKMSNIISNFRTVEIDSSSRYRKILIGIIFFSVLPQNLAPMLTFAVFYAIATARDGNSILAGQAFASLSLIALVTLPALTFIRAIPALIQCFSSFDRIQEYCSQPVRPCHLPENPSSHQAPLVNDKTGSEVEMATMQPSGLQTTVDQPLVRFRDQDIAWEKAGPAILKTLRANIYGRRFTVVLGPTGSGKSTLLESLLDETVSLGGDTDRRFSTAAYCAQVPWLINGSVRDNIVADASGLVDEKWYATVLWACGLESDIATLGQRDRTLVGNGGSNLSGGQRQRVSLARAIYSRKKLILLDDVFSGVDARNTALISERLLGRQGLLRRSLTTVVLVTHAPPLISLADDVIVVENGTITEFGSIDLLRASDGYVAGLQLKSPSESDGIETSSSDEGPSHPAKNAAATAAEALMELNEEEQDLKRQTGDFSVYSYYSRAGGHGTVATMLILVALWVFCTEFSVVIVDWWSAANAKSHGRSNDGQYLGVYVGLGFLGAGFLLTELWLIFVTIISRTAKHLHEDLLKTIMSAPLRFFQETDVGSITNRFSQDMELIGLDLPTIAANYIIALYECVAKVILLAVFAKYLSATLPLIAGSVFFVQRFYLRTSRQVRLLDIEAKGPVYLHFLETTNGANTIRAFGWQRAFRQKLHALLDRSQKPVYLLYCIQQWLALALDLIVAVLAAVLVTILVVWRDSFDPGSVGVSLVTVMTFNQVLALLVKSWTALETSIGAVGRVKSFVEKTTSEETELGIRQPLVGPGNWPARGAICFQNVTAAYKPGGHPVLRNLSIAIAAGEKVAICGRSGSGKTSFVLSLLHMINFTGSISIDGVETQSLIPSDLRSRINVVPQEPFLMPGSIRFNIDPLGQVQDEAIVSTLRRLKIWDRVMDCGGLDAQTSLSLWSVGERQLLCLARAMVRKSQILILDEATSSVDALTESVMQDVLDSDVSTQTVLAVVHRLRYIERFDKVAVLDGGVLVEFDKPSTLLAGTSLLADMYKAGQQDRNSK